MTGIYIKSLILFLRSMVYFQGASKTKKTGGKRRVSRGKRLFELGTEKVELRIGEPRKKTVSGRGSTKKFPALLLNEANVLDLKTGKQQKSEIVNVKENKANPHFVRRNTMTKGALIETKIGIAKIMNRPGQEGCINAVLVEQPKQTPA